MMLKVIIWNQICTCIHDNIKARSLRAKGNNWEIKKQKSLHHQFKLCSYLDIQRKATVFRMPLDFTLTCVAFSSFRHRVSHFDGNFA
jgi:hypothetical protein